MIRRSHPGVIVLDRLYVGHTTQPGECPVIDRAMVEVAAMTVLCQCANHHRWFGWPNVVNVCMTCSGAAINEYVMPVRRSGNVGDHLDQVLQARLSVECCCSVENGGTYCGATRVRHLLLP